MERKADSEYEQFVERTNKIPEVQEYLQSPEAIVHDIALARRMEMVDDFRKQADLAKTEEAGSDYARFVTRTNEIPEVTEHLFSFSTIVGELVLSRRIVLGMTQKQLADLCRTTQARISQIESGYAGIKMETLNKVFFHLGLTNVDPTYREEAAAASRELVGWL